jgi:hypothetical protein
MIWVNELKRVKIITYAPPENIESIRQAVCSAGAGNIGNYSDCSTRIKCIGTFKPLKEAEPFIGQTDKLEEVEENILEVTCSVEKAKEVITEIRKMHPYEEPVIDIIPLLEEDSLCN